MAYQRKGSKKWIISYRIPGRSTPIQESFNSKKEALAREFEIKSIKEIAPSSLAPVPKSGFTLKELQKLYHKDKAMAVRSVANDIYALEKNVYPTIGNKIVEDILEEDIVSIVKSMHKNGTGRSAARVWERVRAMIRWGVKKKLILKDPLPNFTIEKEPYQNKSIPPTSEEIESILDVSPPHLLRAIQLAFYLGVRPGATELFSLRWSDFDLNSGWVRVQSADKGGLPWRDIPLDDSIIPALIEWKTEDDKSEIPWPIHWRGKQISSIKTAWATAKKNAGITRKLRPYDLRHHFTTALLEEGVDPGIVASMMGHTTTRMVHQVYQRVRREGKRAAIAKLPKLKRRDHLPKDGIVVPEDKDLLQ